MDSTSSKEAHTAYLGNSGDLTSFTYGPHVIRFRTPKRLERYTDVRTWDNGYLVVGAQYGGADDPVEEYIDLEPILENLYFDVPGFLAPIKEVRLDDQPAAEASCR